MFSAASMRSGNVKQEIQLAWHYRRPYLPLLLDESIRGSYPGQIQYWLEGCQWIEVLVVLSACETGLGDVQIGEGVMGLRRSFVLAGAKMLVMSLWKVPDQQTQELMVDYCNRILKGDSRAEALRQAQLVMKAKYPDPLYWGAFICQGDPAPLPG